MPLTVFRAPVRVRLVQSADKAAAIRMASPGRRATREMSSLLRLTCSAYSPGSRTTTSVGLASASAAAIVEYCPAPFRSTMSCLGPKAGGSSLRPPERTNAPRRPMTTPTESTNERLLKIGSALRISRCVKVFVSGSSVCGISPPSRVVAGPGLSVATGKGRVASAERLPPNVGPSA